MSSHASSVSSLASSETDEDEDTTEQDDEASDSDEESDNNQSKHDSELSDSTAALTPNGEVGVKKNGESVIDAAALLEQARQTHINTMQMQQDTQVLFGQASNEVTFGCCGWTMLAVSWILVVMTFPFSLIFCIKIAQEYERAVIFRLGRLLSGGAKGPGMFFVLPCCETVRKVDLRVVSFDVPPQEILSKDSVTVAVDAVVYFRIANATISVTNVEDAARSTKLLAQTTLRNILGTKTLAEMLSDREAISGQMQVSLDEATDPWGVKVERVEIKDVRLPVQLQRAMAAEAEAARDARAKVIAAEGEQKASRALKEAAEVISESPSALQLRYLQTLTAISAEKNSTIVFPLPIDLISQFTSGAGFIGGAHKVDTDADHDQLLPFVLPATDLDSRLKIRQ